MESISNYKILRLHNKVGLPLLLFYCISFLIFHFALTNNTNLFKDQVSIVTDLAFFNLVHIVFTFIGLIFISEMRGWHKSILMADPRVKLAIPLTFGAIGLIYLFYFKESLFWTTSRFTLRAYGLHHAVMQTYGIFLLNGSTNRKFELKKYFLGISFSYVIALLTFFFLQKDYQYFTLYPCFIVCSACVFFILKSAVNSRSESLFLLRLIIYPIGIFSPIMALAIAAFHGLEYVLFFKQLGDKSSSKEEIYRFSRTSFFIFASVSLYAILCYYNIRNATFGLAPTSYYNEFKAPAQWIFFWWFMDSLNVLHYFYDSIMFRVKSIESKKYILALLKSNR